jgi:hypothetical protein
VKDSQQRTSDETMPPTHPFLEPRARQSPSLGAMLSACVLDWRRRGEVSWWSYAAHVAVLVGGSFAVTYLMPQ